MSFLCLLVFLSFCLFGFTSVEGMFCLSCAFQNLIQCSVGKVSLLQLLPSSSLRTGSSKGKLMLSSKLKKTENSAPGPKRAEKNDHLTKRLKLLTILFFHGHFLSLFKYCLWPALLYHPTQSAICSWE